MSCRGGLSHFKKETGPVGGGNPFFDGKYKKPAIYDCVYQCGGRNKGPAIGRHKFKWGTYAFCTTGKKKDIIEALKNDPRGKLGSR